MNKTFSLIVMFLLSISCAKVELPNENNSGIYIKDPVFRQWCYEHLDVNRDGKISPAETQAVRDIRFDYDKTYAKMTSLIGIERFINLEYLDIYSYVKDLSCLKANNKLKYIRTRGGVLENIFIPESVIEIGDNSFVQSITSSIILGKDLEKIGDAAFYCMPNISKVNIPENVTYIGQKAFCCCKKLSEFSGKFASDDGRCLVQDGRLIATALCGLDSYAIPDGVRSIGSESFYGVKLSQLVLPDGITKVCYDAFQNAEIKSFIGKSISDDQQYIIIDNALQVFIGRKTECIIPDDVTTICEGAFCNNKNIQKVIIPNSIKRIEWRTFSSCPNLKNVTISKNVEHIGGIAFDCCRECTIRCEATTPPEIDGYSTFGRKNDGSIVKQISVPAESLELYKKAWKQYSDIIVAY